MGKKWDANRGIRFISRILLFGWICILTKLIVWKHAWYVYRNYFRDEYPQYSLADGLQKANFIPFHSIRSILQEPGRYEFWMGNISGNILGFIPLGILIPLSQKEPFQAGKTILLVLGISIFFECVQGILGTGIMDVDDLILNSLGGSLGYLLYHWTHGKRTGKC